MCGSIEHSVGGVYTDRPSEDWDSLGATCFFARSVTQMWADLIYNILTEGAITQPFQALE